MASTTKQLIKEGDTIFSLEPSKSSKTKIEEFIRKNQ